jgi:putative membrane protein
VLVFHIFGVILWIGSLLLISTLMMLVADEVGVAKERLIVGARRLFNFSGNIGAAVAILFGALALVAAPETLEHGWMHLKIVLVLLMLVVHVRLYLRIVALENDPGAATRREFSIIHGIASAVLIAILFLVFIRPF